MVFGRISQIFPEYKIRFSTMGKRTEFKLEDIFEISDEQYEINCDEEIKKVTRPVVSNVITMGYGFGGYGHGFGGYGKNVGEVRIYGKEAGKSNIQTSGQFTSKQTPIPANEVKSQCDYMEEYYEQMYGNDWKDPFHSADSVSLDDPAGTKKIKSRTKGRQENQARSLLKYWKGLIRRSH